MSVHQTHQRGVIKRAALQTKPALRKARRELTPRDYPQAVRPPVPISAPSATPRDELDNSAGRYFAVHTASFLRRGRLAPRKGVNVNASAKQNANLNPYEAF